MQLSTEHLENYIHALEEADKAFVGDIAKDYVAQAQADIFFQLGMRDRELMKAGLDLVATTTGAYHKAMLDIVGKFQSGAFTFDVAYDQWKAATKIAMNGMYRGGGMSVGNPFFKDLKIPQKDLRLMAKYLNKEAGFFKQFLRDIKDPKHTANIPVDKYGRRLPGYRFKMFDYSKRAGFYADSMKAMRYNGMVMGSGSLMEIFWVLGAPQTEHCDDCPVLAKRVWTSETLFTVPGAGDTKCKWRCYCHLEFRQKISKTTFDIAGSATRGALMAPGRQAMVYDTSGAAIGGQLQADIEGYMARMYKARQMIEITTGSEQMQWIQQRKYWNRMAIDRAEAGQYRVVPTVSSSALVKTIQSVYGKGGTLVDDLRILSVGDEVWFVRGDYSSFGMMGMQDGILVFKSPTGLTLRPVGETDVVFSTAAIEGKLSTKLVDLVKNITKTETIALETYLGSDYKIMREYLKMSFAGRKAFKAKGAYYSNFAKKAETVEKLFSKYKGDTQEQVLYRGISNVDDDVYNWFKNQQVGSIVKIDKALSSWSTSHSVATSFSSGYQNNIRFHLVEGRINTKELSVMQFSAESKEMEVLIGNIEFRVVNVYETLEGTKTIRKVLDVFLEEIR